MKFWASASVFKEIICFYCKSKSHPQHIVIRNFYTIIRKFRLATFLDSTSTLRRRLGFFFILATTSRHDTKNEKVFLCMNDGCTQMNRLFCHPIYVPPSKDSYRNCSCPCSLLPYSFVNFWSFNGIWQKKIKEEANTPLITKIALKMFLDIFGQRN